MAGGTEASARRLKMKRGTLMVRNSSLSVGRNIKVVSVPFYARSARVLGIR